MNFWIIIWSIVIGYILNSLYTFWRNIAHFRDNNIPYKTPCWIFGNLWSVFIRKNHFFQVLQDVYNKCPKAKYTGFFDFSHPVIIINDVDLIKSVGVKHSESFPDHRSFVDEKVDPFFGLNLLSLKGQKWHSVRTMLSPAFTSSKMKAMFQLVVDCATDFADFIEEQSSKGNDEFELKDVFTRYTNDVIATCAFGIKTDSMRERNNEFYVLGRRSTNFEGILSIKFFALRNFPGIVKLLKIRLIEEKVTKFFTNVISQTVATRDKHNISRPDMLQLMMDARGKATELNIDEMTAQAFIFFFGGFDTTSTLMSFAAYAIATNPEIHEKLQAEVDEVWQKMDGKLQYEAITEMPYMDAVINETLRMYPPALFTDRLCVKEFELPPNLPGQKPYTIKPGTNVWFPIYNLHHDPKHFPNPETFDPERFYQKQIASNHPAFLPFGLGPRMCIGNRFALQEAKIVLFQLLVRCNFKVTQKTCVPMRYSKLSFVLQPQGGFRLKLEPRKKLFISRPVHRHGSITA